MNIRQGLDVINLIHDEVMNLKFHGLKEAIGLFRENYLLYYAWGCFFETIAAQPIFYQTKIRSCMLI